MASSSLKFLLGFYPKTDKIESTRNELIKEFEALTQFSNSEELARFQYLEQYVNSPEFTERKKQIEALVFKGSEEERNENEYYRLKKSAEIKFFYKFKASVAYAQYLSLNGSKAIADFEALKAFVESQQFKKAKAYANDKHKWEKTEEFAKQQEFQKLAESHEIKNYFKFIHAKEFADFQKLYLSDEISEFETFEKYTHSPEFKTLSKKEANDEVHQKYIAHKKKKEQPLYKHYFHLRNSNLFDDFRKLYDSKELSHYKALEEVVKSPQFIEKKKQVESLRFKDTPEYKKEEEYNQLASSKDIRMYYKMKASKQLAQFEKLNGSKTITDYETLEKYILSDAFKSRKAYLLDKSKWNKTEEYQLQDEYEQLKKSPKITWYLSVKDSDKFNELKKWKLTFQDDFSNAKLDREKWLTRYYWGEMVLNDTYALPGEKHLFTDGKNISINDSTAKITTQSEKIKGKEWNPIYGFNPKEFDYTSAILCSGNNFRLKYGKIEAKIKINPGNDVMHAFWLAGNTITPQIDVFKCISNKLMLSTFWDTDPNKPNHESLVLKASTYTGKYLIYSLEWTPEKLTWRINNVEIKTQTTNIPSEPMHVVLNSGVYGENPKVPASMEIDWIRCFEYNN
ncbi:MAG: glycoside hydrolase family 16 protein [Bacteroidota bacterium]|nr:glycoside hydrolase family 16 protein [Bacteroidota bacterium]